MVNLICINRLIADTKELQSIYSKTFSEKMNSLHENYSCRSLRKIKMHLLSLDRRCNGRNI